MPVNWNLANPGGGFDYLESLQSIGNVALQRQRIDQSQSQIVLRQRAGTQIQNGNFGGAASTALQGGDLDLARTIGGMQQDQRKRLAQEAIVASAAASRIRTLPQAQREQALIEIAPTLQRYGFAPQELSGLDLTDQGLDGYLQVLRGVLDTTDKQDEPSVIRSLRAVGIDPQSAAGRDIVTRSLTPPRYLPNGDGTFTVVGGAGEGGAPPQHAGAAGPQPGTVEDGYRFRGGDPANPASWEPVGGAPSQGGATFP